MKSSRTAKHAKPLTPRQRAFNHAKARKIIADYRADQLTAAFIKRQSDRVWGR